MAKLLWRSLNFCFESHPLLTELHASTPIHRFQMPVLRCLSLAAAVSVVRIVSVVRLVRVAPVRVKEASANRP